MRTVYFDNNATTVLEHAVADSMLSFFSETQTQNYGNPMSIHWAGRKAKLALDIAREQITAAFDVEDPSEICFTGSGSESINMALKGAFFKAQAEGKQVHIFHSTVEHEASLQTVEFLEGLGAKSHPIAVDSDCQLLFSNQIEKIESLAQDTDNFLLCSLMVANNETGVIFPYQEVAEVCAKNNVLLHLDAVQAPGKVAGFSIKQAGADLVSLSAHKIGGPKGVGALFCKKGVKLAELIHGGAQERKRRAGTQNVAGIVGFGKAASLLADYDLKKVEDLRNYFENKLVESISGVKILAANSKRLVNTSNFVLEDVRGDSLLMSLDLEGFAVSSGSACSSGSLEPSHVLLAMGLDEFSASSGLRLSLSHHNNQAEVDEFLEVLPEIVARIRKKAREKRANSC